MIQSLIYSACLVMLIVDFISNRIWTKKYIRYTEAINEQNRLLTTLREIEQPILQDLAIVLLRLKNQEDIGKDAVKSGDGLEE